MAQYKQAAITILPGDITAASSDALMTLINSGGFWFGGIDGAIQRVAGPQFHQIAREQMPHPIQQGAVIFADGSHIQHRGAFRHVVFVIDDLRLPLRDLVKAGLEEVYARGLSSVSLPMMRTGVMAGKVEKTPEDVTLQMAEAIKQVADAYPGRAMKITIVIYDDAAIWGGRLRAALPAYGG